MSSTAKALLIILGVALIVFAWMFRVNVQGSGSSPSAIVTDRWLGTVQWCIPYGDGGKCVHIYPQKNSN
jgi:hypothetical protein